MLFFQPTADEIIATATTFGGLPFSLPFALSPVFLFLADYLKHYCWIFMKFKEHPQVDYWLEKS